jgi:outer membrane protein TolC
MVPAGVFAQDQAAGTKLTFESCLSLAKKYSASLISQQENVNQAGWQKLKAGGAMLPSVAMQFGKQYGYSNSNFVNGGWQTEITADQPIFYGTAKLRQVFLQDSELKKQEYLLKNSWTLLAERVAQAYYGYASALSDMHNAESAVDLIKKRVIELNGWAALGKSRKSDLYSAEAKVSQLVAQVTAARNNAFNASLALAFVIGQNGGGMLDIDVPEAGTLTAAATDADIETLAQNRSDYRSQKEELDAQSRRIEIEQAAFLPQVNLNVSSVLGGSPSAGGGLTALLSAQWPIFEGGARIADNAVALSQKTALEAQTDELLRQITIELKGRYADLQASYESVTELGDAYEKTDKSFKEQENGYSLGAVTNLDVLQSMQDLIDTKTALDREKVIALENAAMFDIASEKIK